jgi:hypothetical protein
MLDSVLNERPGKNNAVETEEKSAYSADTSPANSPVEAGGAGSKDVEDYGEKPDTIDDASNESLQEDRNREEQLESGVPVSKVSTRISVNNVSSIPNGGLKAWLQVLGSFFLFFNTW